MGDRPNRGRETDLKVNYADLPERVRAAVRAQQDASEILIGWVQLGVVALFGGLYLVSPKTFDGDAEFAPVPWVLGVYLGFTVMRLALAYRGPMHHALLYVSVALDMGLLFALIWSFHLQYMQPPSFYLKAPTLLYVFIFIALRALRFEARFVVAAGVVAAIGWAGLAWYSIAGPDGMARITQDYVLYMTSNRVLIGAEIDKIVSILTVTAIIAVAIHRARRLLISAVAEGAAAHSLSRFFAPEVARQITAAETELRAGEGQACDATIVFTDIRDFTLYAETVAPAELIAALSEYQALVVGIIQDRNGTIDKFMGDGVMATFGAARPSDTNAADALGAIDALMRAADRWNAARADAGKPVLRIGAAAASGRVICGAVGDETRLEYTVIGPAVNLAAKLEKHTKVERVRAVCAAETFERARAQGYRPADGAEPRLSRSVEGLDHPVDIVVVAA